MTISPHDEWAAVADRFGVDMEQVRRDHLISHLLAAIAAHVSTDDVVFFGGTALSRTYLTDARLSQDVDLIALAPRTDVAGQIEAAVRRDLARSHGRPTWRPALSATTGSQPTTLAFAGTASVQVQLVSGEGYLWPTEVRDIEQRYSDAPPVRLRTLTPAGFAGVKFSAWMDRHAPRDLYDLWGMGERGLIDAGALEVFVRRGPQARPPASWVFETAPDETVWRGALGHQTRLRVTAADALDSVREAWRLAASA